MTVLFGKAGEEDGAARAGRAHGQVVAARLHNRSRSSAGGGQGGDLRIDRRELDRRTVRKSGHGAAVPMPACFRTDVSVRTAPLSHAVGSQSTLPASSAYPTKAPMSSSAWAATSGPTRPHRR